MAVVSVFDGGQVREYVLTLPEPPSINTMIELAKKRRRMGRHLLPVVYSDEKAAYGQRCLIAFREAGGKMPRHPWSRWSIEAVEIRRHQLLDHVEALSCLKWPVDWLKQAGFVEDDSPRHLIHVPLPVQVVDRANRGITIHIVQVLP